MKLTRDAFLPDDVPLPGAKPSLRRSRMHEKTEAFAYTAGSSAAEKLRPGLFSRYRQATPTVAHLPSSAAICCSCRASERLEAHSGLGPMRDNPRYEPEKPRALPPHTYDLRMREALFHGVRRSASRLSTAQQPL